MSAELLQLTLSAAALSAFLIGFSFGTGPCNLSCLPYLGPVLLGPASERAFTTVILPFMSGRLCGYLSLGIIAAAVGQVLQTLLKHPGIPIFVAGITFWLAVKMWRQAPKKICSQSHAALKDQASIDSHSKSADIIATDAVISSQAKPPQGIWHLSVLGFSLALTPCVPLLSLLSVAAQSADIVWGGLVALCFGLGAIVVPSLLVRYGVALLGNELRIQLSQWQTALSRTGAVMLVLVAINTAVRGVPV